jgi:iron(III) transport system substrate-binding protein
MPRLVQESISRRSALRMLSLAGGSALLAACQQAAPSPTAAPAKPTTQPAAPATANPTAVQAAPAAATPSAAEPAGAISEAEWNNLVAAAKQEGVLSLATYAGGGYRKVVEDFQAAFPGINVEHQQFQSSSRDYVPRLLQEQKAGLFSFDIATMPNVEMLRQVKPAGGLEPLRPLLVRADVLDDASWNGGFARGFSDYDAQWGYVSIAIRIARVWVNTELVKDGEIRTVNDLIDPKWKGQIVAADPRTKGSGFSPATVMRLKSGRDDVLKQFFKDQEPTILTDTRQLTEFMVRGRFAIGFGAVDKVILGDFLEQGLGKQLKPLDLDATDTVTGDTNSLWYLARAPHPKAAQVFANWFLTQKGQASFSQNLLVNSRRTDVPIADPDAAPTPGIDYITSDHESVIPEMQKTQDLAKELLD